ncbi:hypothetical protein [Denitratisoma oestradiolicum]|uniref:Uncharacterized protein n=1 Tax=Denitratisoma oestradiolicum TaxID=311182 RepID=A0A6S6Y4P1_9PROT|nr:hypothetical protein [Denitratisoma oestradiolicum]TWO79331.1 hypothetical protein CBW56_15600 [Denitratisoma oestradiolicum]CAB1370340.1 conserved protein of unknown function [Denitratisoma oestradiolicum]
MDKARIIEDEFGSFADEVLNAGWLPPCPELGSTLGGPATRSGMASVEIDVGAFLKTVYASQE